ncbi:MAG TPA: tyrosine-type recombinase/integrase, partial [Thermoanaerobaculia bacterium]|nr:tyrosine-type recombinase/integrase [Thermoanaerobaculia bacterium]
MTISQATDIWLGELIRKGRRPRTVAAYRRLLDLLAGSYPLVDVEDITPTMCRRFLDGWSANAPGTMAQVVSCLTGYFGWLRDEGLVKTTPMERIRRPKRTPDDENDRIVSVSEDDVLKLLAAVQGWDERLALNVALYLGPRRRALAEVRRSDYDARSRTLTFAEKGGKAIRKPVPHRLAEIIDEAIAAGVYASGSDYLIPGAAPQLRKGERDDRVIWRLVKQVAKRAGVKTHVHALRAAFAVHFLEAHPGEVFA